MSEKLLAGLVTAVVIAPICALCILGPAVLGSLLAGTLGWLGGLGPVRTTGLMLIAGVVVYGLVRTWNTRRSGASASSEPRPRRR